MVLKNIYSNENQNFSKSHEIHKIKDKIIASLKINTTHVLIEKTIFIMQIENKNLRRSIFCSDMVDCLAS